MLYKEWKVTKVKFWVWLTVFGGAAGLTLLIWVLQWGRNAQATLFQSWLIYGLVTMAVAAVLGGVDIIAEEKASGTLSFLLTRPIRRSQVYLGKIGVNFGALLVAFAPFSFLLLAIDRLNPTPIVAYKFITGPCIENLGCSGSMEPIITGTRSIDLGQGLSGIIVFGLVGAGIICLSGLVSIFARNTMQAMGFMLPVWGGLSFLIVASATNRFFYSQNPSPWPFIFGEFTVPLLFSTVGILLAGGLLAFKRKEF